MIGLQNFITSTSGLGIRPGCKQRAKPRRNGIELLNQHIKTLVYSNYLSLQSTEYCMILGRH